MKRAIEITVENKDLEFNEVLDLGEVIDPEHAHLKVELFIYEFAHKHSFHHSELEWIWDRTYQEN